MLAISRLSERFASKSLDKVVQIDFHQAEVCPRQIRAEYNTPPTFSSSLDPPDF